MKRKTSHLAIVIMLIGITQSRIMGQDEINDESEGEYKSPVTVSSALDTLSDSVEFTPKKYVAKYNWEKAVSLPLEIVYLPLKLFFEGTKVTIGFVDESQLIPRVKYLLTCDDGSCGTIPTYASLSGAGVKIYQKGWFAPESKLDLSLSAGPKRRQTYQLRFRNNKLFGNTISSDYFIRYKFLPDERYFFSNIETNESNFAHEQITGEATFGKEFGTGYGLNAVFGLTINNIFDGRGDTKSTSKFISLGEQVTPRSDNRIFCASPTRTRTTSSPLFINATRRATEPRRRRSTVR